MFKKNELFDRVKVQGQLHPYSLLELSRRWVALPCTGRAVLQKHELMAQTTYGEVADTSFIDWPLGMQELSSFYAKAEDRWGSQAQMDVPIFAGQ